MRKLRVAQFVTSHFTTPPPPPIVYAPIDIAIAITTHLAHRGHEITYFAPEGSHIQPGQLETLNVTALKKLDGADLQEQYIIPDSQNIAEWRLGSMQTVWDQYFLAHIFRRASQGEFDIIHSHAVSQALALAHSHPQIPTIYTLHNFLNPWRNFLYSHFVTSNQQYVSISDSQRKSAPELPYINTIHNGVNLDKFPFGPTSDQHLLFVGRLVPRKGVVEAIQAAQLSKQKLIIIGPIDDQPYWEKQIKPLLNDQIAHYNFVDRSELYKFYQQAKALLFPIQWEEPFGLVMIEAMACGTPVIAFRRGSVPEVVVDGQTGFIVDTVEKMVEAVKKIDSIDRRACREHVEKNFSIEKMVDGYEQAYYDILDKARSK